MGNCKSKNSVSPAEIDIENNQCYICLENCMETQCTCKSYCHSNCYEEYLRKRITNTCPHCRKNLGNISIYSPNLANENDFRPNILTRILTAISRFITYMATFIAVLIIFVVILPITFGMFVSVLIYICDTNIYNKISLAQFMMLTWIRNWSIGFCITLILTYMFYKKERRDRNMVEIRRILSDGRRSERRGRRNRALTVIATSVF